MCGFVRLERCLVLEGPETGHAIGEPLCNLCLWLGNNGGDMASNYTTIACGWVTMGVIWLYSNYTTFVCGGVWVTMGVIWSFLSSNI